MRHVDQPTARGHGIDDRAAFSGDRQIQRVACPGFPSDEVAAAGVGNAVIGRAIRGVAPHPNHVIPAIGAFFRHAGIGIHAVLPIQQGRGMQPPPRLGLHVVHIVKIHAIATFAISKSENQFPIWAAHKHGIGAAIFVFAHHRGNAFKTRYIARARGAKINQRIHMHIPAQVNAPLVVNGHGHRIVAVPSDLGRQPPAIFQPDPFGLGKCPRFFVEMARPHGHFAVRIVKRHKLPVAVRQQVKPDGMTGPDGCDKDRSENFHNSSNWLRQPQ